MSGAAPHPRAVSGNFVGVSIRRRWWDNEAELERLASDYHVTERYVENIIRRRTFDSFPTVPGERTVEFGEKLSMVRLRATTRKI
jgi:hypothetical protein